MRNILKDFRSYFKSKNPYMMTGFDDYNKKHQALISPYILEERELHVTQLDVFSRLMMQRTIFFTGEVEDTIAAVTQAELLYLDGTGVGDINMYINSPGGSCSSGLGVVDTMNYVQSDVATINVGMAASMGSLLLVSGARGKRRSLPNAEVLIHQPLIGGHGISGPTDDITIEAEQMKMLKERLFKIIAQRTGQPYEKIVEDARRDFWLTAEAAKDYGCIDEIIKVKLD